MSFNILSLNIRGLQNDVKRRAIFNYVRNCADVVCLQETHSTPQDEEKWKMEWGGNVYFSHGSSASKGVCVLIKPSLPIVIRSLKSDINGRVVVLDVTIGTFDLCLCALYAPNTNNPKFLGRFLMKPWSCHPTKYS